MIAQIQKRSLLIMLLFMIITGGLYFFYWQYVTKQDINRLGGQIPSLWFAIFPFFNIYFDYWYAYYFVKEIYKQEDSALVLAFFTLLLVLPIFAPFIIQYKLNALAQEPEVY